MIEEGDLVELSLKHRSLNIVGIKGERKAPAQIEAVLAERRKHLQQPKRRYTKGALGLYTKLACSAMKGGHIEF